MKSYFSKPCGAVLGRQSDFLDKNALLVEKSAKATEALLRAPLREKCTLCASRPSAENFLHRGAPYFMCATCGQVQTLNDSALVDWDPEQYAQVYPELSPEARQERMNSIYTPKLDWMLEASQAQLEISQEQLFSKKWLEVGCGEGLFLEALRDKGAAQIGGIDVDDHMVERCCQLLGENCVEKSQNTIHDVVRVKKFDVLIAWYVLEHIFELDLLSKSLSQLPSGTLFCFAVPMYGFSSILESAVVQHYSRTLDNSVHTQLFTDESIDYFLDKSGFSKAAQWVFGQDVADLGRVFSLGLAEHYPGYLADAFNEKFTAAFDEIQQTLDGHFLSDSRHILAVKK